MTRRSYNASMASWWASNPTLAQLRQLYGTDDLKDEAAAYAAEQGPVKESPEDSEAVTDYRDRRGF